MVRPVAVQMQDAVGCQLAGTLVLWEQEDPLRPHFPSASCFVQMEYHGVHFQSEDDVSRHLASFRRTLHARRSALVEADLE